MTNFVWCVYCQSAIGPEDRRCPSCGASRPEHPRYREANYRREWPQYEQDAVVAMSTAAVISFNTTSIGAAPMYFAVGTTEGFDDDRDITEDYEDYNKEVAAVDEAESGAAAPAPPARRSLFDRLFR